jgi:hypothetical protein
MTSKPVADKLDDVRKDRESDLVLLTDLLNDDEKLSDEEVEAFVDMHGRLQRQQAHSKLSDKQRKWAEDVADRLGISYTRRSAKQAQNVPKGREVKLPDVLSQDALKAALAARRK